MSIDRLIETQSTETWTIYGLGNGEPVIESSAEKHILPVINRLAEILVNRPDKAVVIEVLGVI